MDWIIWHHLVWFVIGAITGDLGWAIVKRLWRGLGRRRDQRRTEARLHEEGKRRLLRARDKVQAELRAEGRLQTNGAESSAPRRSHGRASGR